MRFSIILLVLSAVVLGSCTSAYKSGQTPDDVYYSPQRPQQDEYVNFDQRDDSRYYSQSDNNYNGNDDDYYDDQYLRMKVQNRLLWSNLDDWYYYNPIYSYSYYNTWNWSNPWSPYTYWNYYYNPYCSPVILTSKSGLVYNHPRVFNLNTYNNSMLTHNNYTSPREMLNNNNYNNNYYNSINKPGRRSNSYVPQNTNNNKGNFLRNLFNNSSGNNNNSSSGNTNRTSGNVSTPSSSGSSSRSSGSAPVRKF
jgi:hypothetical protein